VFRMSGSAEILLIRCSVAERFVNALGLVEGEILCRECAKRRLGVPGMCHGEAGTEAWQALQVLD
jgi:hypothetical protein